MAESAWLQRAAGHSDWNRWSQSAGSDQRARFDWHRATGGTSPTGIRDNIVLSGRRGREKAAGRNGAINSQSARAAGGGIERRAGTRAPHRLRRESSAFNGTAVRVPRAVMRVALVQRERRGRVFTVSGSLKCCVSIGRWKLSAGGVQENKCCSSSWSISSCCHSSAHLSRAL